MQIKVRNENGVVRITECLTKSEIEIFKEIKPGETAVINIKNDNLNTENPSFIER